MCLFAAHDALRKNYRHHHLVLFFEFLFSSKLMIFYVNTVLILHVDLIVPCVHLTNVCKCCNVVSKLDRFEMWAIVVRGFNELGLYSCVCSHCHYHQFVITGGGGIFYLFNQVFLNFCPSLNALK